MQQRILEALELGADYKTAAAYAGVCYDSFREYRNTFSAFSASVAAAEAKAAMRWLARINRCALDGDWRPAAWLLERRYPHAYGRHVQEQHHSGNLGLEVAYVNNWRGPAADRETIDILISRRAQEQAPPGLESVLGPTALLNGAEEGGAGWQQNGHNHSN